MTRDIQTLSIRFVTDLLSNVVDNPRFNPEWLTLHGLTPELLALPGARITLEEFASLYRTIAVAIDDETVGLFARPLRNGTLKYLCMLMLHAPQLRVALNRFRNFMRLVNDDVLFEVGPEHGGQVRIILHERADLGATRLLALELMLMLVQGVASWLVARKIPFHRIAFPFAQPVHASDYECLYPGPIRYDQGQTALHMDAAWLYEPIRQDQATLHHFLQDVPLNWFYFSDSNRPRTHLVRNFLKERLHQGPTILDVAEALHASPRTLARHLSAEGTSFQRIKDMLRRDVAIELLNKTAQPVAAIGNSLGFEDPAAFNRAFRQWTGSAPGAYRKRPANTKLRVADTSS
ncbi:AraC family transcriptional regulator [Castellaniella sp.]|uniref:AraC family transcriptional regulator n=1 Tax=Castellaniella sp. TaxID=1955812 RepID=UPI00355D1931